ncbi:ATP-binding cassette domain-containing protein [Rhodomicrobium lacus]|uniref:ATP-binding cassette domain-containing protein n=1 Tax=Rhodomicrobium lacus TaxID=2498452 RepID=UPI000F8C3D71|nr:ATP-binding cassette domain-containing protein [Rhodomicrobium lacus]
MTLAEGSFGRLATHRSVSEKACAASEEESGASASSKSRAAPGVEGLSLAVRAVGKSFGDRQVLQNIDIEIPAGQFVAIVGRSGGGKTTLMRLITGLDAPTSGEVVIDGKPTSGLQKSVRLLFQDARLLPWETVIGNVGISREPNWREDAAAALADVGLSGREKDWPAVLSGGQRQRVSLARALVSRPGILLLDEPFGALDALTRAEMHQLTERIWQEHRFTTVLITHDVAEAVTLADRVLVLRDGDFALDIDIDLPRPRRGYDPAAAALVAEILKQV